MVNMMRGLVGLVAMTLVACAGGPEAGDAPEYRDGTTQPSSSAGATSSAQTSSSSDEGDRQVQQPESNECRLQGRYRLTAMGCGNSVDYDAGAITGLDTESCSLTVSIGGMHSVRVECEPGDPVTDCTGTTTSDSGCVVEWTMYSAS